MVLDYVENEGCIALIERIPDGILRLLDEACKRPGGPDDGFFAWPIATKHRTDGRRGLYLSPAKMAIGGGGKRKRLRDDEAFAVRHFAGDVCYTAAGFTEKNNDTLHPDFANMLAAEQPIAAAFAVKVEEDSASDGAAGGSGLRSGRSVARLQ